MTVVGNRDSIKSATRAAALLAIGLALLGLAGCGQARRENRPAVTAHNASAKAGFIVAADRICVRHLQTILAWLEKPQTGDVWQRRAAQNEGTYRIIAATISRLQTLGPAPGPTSGAFAGYLTTLKARAALFRLTGIAYGHRDGSTAALLQRRVDQIKPIGDRDAHRYGLNVCGTGPGDIAPLLDRAPTIQV